MRPLLDQIPWSTYDDEVARALVENLDALYSTALRLCSREDAAEDLVQECVRKALEGSTGLTHQRQLRAWIFKILINCMRDYFRQHARNLEEPFPEEELHLNNANWQISAMVSNTSQDIRLALDALTVERRAVVLLVDWEGFTLSDAAAILNLPVGTVASRLARAHMALREFLRTYHRGKSKTGGKP